MAIKGNQKLTKNHYNKGWDRFIKTHFDQAGKKASRRAARKVKAAKLAPRPVDLLRPVVRCPTLKYNRRTRLGRGFSLVELKAAGIPKHYARTIGISVDPRRANLSDETLATNVERLKAYQARLIVYPRKSNKLKKTDTSKDQWTGETVSHVTSVFPRAVAAPAFTEVKTSEMPKPIEGSAYAALRKARSDQRQQGAREKRAKEKAEAEVSKK